jgi:hypothetical protein
VKADNKQKAAEGLSTVRERSQMTAIRKNAKLVDTTDTASKGHAILVW